MQLRDQPIVTPTAPLPNIADLTQKEEEILHLICAKKSNKEIAAELYVEVSTVKTHINKIYSKLEISDRKSAIAFTKK